MELPPAEARTRRYCSQICAGKAGNQVVLNRALKRLGALVPSPNGCIEWTGARHPKGYGVLTMGNKRHIAHRVAWEQVNGPIPDGMMLRHSCDNPPCVNVKHLKLGTAADNSTDMVERRRSLKGDAQPNAVLSDEQAREILRRRRGGEKGVVLASEFRISPQTVCDIYKGRGWAHLHGSGG